MRKCFVVVVTCEILVLVLVIARKLFFVTVSCEIMVCCGYAQKFLSKISFVCYEAFSRCICVIMCISVLVLASTCICSCMYTCNLFLSH